MTFNVSLKSEFPKKKIHGRKTMKNKLIGCWVSVQLSFYAYNFLSDGKGFYSFGMGKKEFTYTDNVESVTIHFNGDFMPSTFKYTIEEDVLLIEDSFGTTVKYIKQGEVLL